MTKKVLFGAGPVLAFFVLAGSISLAEEDKFFTSVVLEKWFEQTKFAAPLAVRKGIGAQARDAAADMVERRSYTAERVRDALDEALGPYLSFLADASVVKGPTLRGLMLEAIAPGGAMARKAKTFPVVTVRFDVTPDRVFVNGQLVNTMDGSFNLPLGDVRISAEKEGEGSCAVTLVSEMGNNYDIACSLN